MVNLNWTLTIYPTLFCIFAYMNPFTPDNSMGGNSIIVPILQTKKPRHRVVA